MYVFYASVPLQSFLSVYNRCSQFYSDKNMSIQLRFKPYTEGSITLCQIPGSVSFCKNLNALFYPRWLDDDGI